ncbi:MAG: hypothetical protein KJ926_03100 [Candidatus Omnitrophica bacterium]|nr:hypothetical protein [Candidatus Omnitrophota bacterium]
MKITTYGTRGSIPIARGDSAKYGGNTTSLRIFSDCIPDGTALAVDAGSGFVPLCHGLLGEGIMDIAMIMTHYHHDHTQGFPLSPHPFMPGSNIKVWGPRENGTGPQEVFSAIMKTPFFPMDYAMVRNGITCKPLMHIGTQVLAVHPEGGFSLMGLSPIKLPQATKKATARLLKKKKISTILS